MLSGSFTATGQSAAIAVRGGVALVLKGTFVATVKLERSLDNGTSWDVLSLDSAGSEAAWSAPVNLSLVEPIERTAALYRLNCTAYTSGTVSYVVAA